MALPPTSFTVTSSTSITATSPAEPAGTVDVTVTTPVGTSATGSADKFTYQAFPTVTGVTPGAGITTGNTTVTITGTGLNGATAVKFGANAGTILTDPVAGTSMTVKSPAGSAGTVDITVTTPIGTSATSTADQFLYELAPTVTAVTPVAGVPGGGTSLTITGTGFADATTVMFGVVAENQFTYTSPTQLTAVISPSEAAGTVDITVVTPAGTSSTSAADHFSFAAVPTVTAVNPVTGVAGGSTSVNVTGTGFVAGATTVSFGANAGTGVNVSSPTSLSVTSPAGSGMADVTVTTPVGTSATSSLDEFTYQATPTVALVTPVAGPVGGNTVVTITGTGFVGESAVKFGPNTATNVTVNSATSITAWSPPGSAGAVNVTVTTPLGTGTDAAAFTYEAVPTVTALSVVSPTAGGTAVNITGTNFTGASVVSFGATTATAGWTVASTTSITGAVAPAEAAGTVNVTVTTPLGASAATGANQYTYSNTTWSQAASSTGAGALREGSEAYDPATGQTILFGGFNGSTYYNNTWDWNGANWVQLSPATVPSLRSGASLAYDTATSQLVLFGGYNGSTYLNDTWTWSGTNWVVQSPTTQPAPRAGFLGLLPGLGGPTAAVRR